jgi:mannose-6-phosphate isomerase-like protein (cupin superfamily)
MRGRDLGASRARILVDGSRTGGRLGLAEFWLAPGFTGPPQHVHRAHEETLFVLSGTIDFTSGTDTTRVIPGNLVTVPETSMRLGGITEHNR